MLEHFLGTVTHFPNIRLYKQCDAYITETERLCECDNRPLPGTQSPGPLTPRGRKA